MKKLITLLFICFSLTTFAQTNWTNMVGAQQSKDSSASKIVRFRFSNGLYLPIVTPVSLGDSLKTKQIKLVSGTNIKTVNGTSLLGSGNIVITGADSTVFRAVANSKTLAQTQTALNLKANLSGGNNFSGTQSNSGDFITTSTFTSKKNGTNTGVGMLGLQTTAGVNQGALGFFGDGTSGNPLNDISLFTYDNTGVSTGTPFRVNRLTGVATFSQTIAGSITGNAATSTSATTAGTATIANSITGQANSATITASPTTSANTISQRNAFGDITARYFSTDATGVDSDPISYMMTTDANLIRKSSAIPIRTFLSINNVDNTSDANKPISTATQTALNLKANSSAVVDLTTAQTIAGTKTFSVDAVINGLTVGRGGASQIENVALGSNALVSNTGFFNTAIGRNALTLNSSGSSNTVVGSGSGQVISTGSANTILGSNTGVGIQTGSGNTLLGQNGTAYASALTNNIIIAGGAGVKAQHDGTNWTLTGGATITGRISPLDIATTNIFIPSTNFISFDSGVSSSYTIKKDGTGNMIYSSAGGHNFSGLGTGTVYSNSGTLTNTNPSDSTLKNTINPLNYGLKEILQLKPKTFYYNSDSTKSSLKYGFIAQEVKTIMPDLVRKISKDSDKLGLETDGIYVTLVKAIQEQQLMIKNLEERIKVLEAK